MLTMCMLECNALHVPSQSAADAARAVAAAALFGFPEGTLDEATGEVVEPEPPAEVRRYMWERDTIFFIGEGCTGTMAGAMGRVVVPQPPPRVGGFCSFPCVHYVEMGTSTSFVGCLALWQCVDCKHKGLKEAMSLTQHTVCLQLQGSLLPFGLRASMKSERQSTAMLNFSMLAKWPCCRAV